MTKPQKNLLLCATLTIVLAVLLIRGAAFAGQLDFSRPKGSTSSAGANATPPQIGSAQLLVNQALGKVNSALSADWSGKPHALTAKALLEQAFTELGLAHTGTNTGN